jgi:hypothetical protein
MKNIHVLPTDKPSRLGLNNEILDYAPLFGFELFDKNKNFRHNPVNIYITSDEEIKDGDWILEISDNSIFTIQIQPNTNLSKYKKIILTTDPSLAPDVQKIDDEFLEWFVKNPSCEEVEVIYEPKNFFDVKKGWEYKIIIPKEEPNIIDQWLEKNGNPEITKQVDEEAKKLQKQHLIDMMKADEELGLYEQTKCYCGHTTTCDCGPEQETNLNKHQNSLAEYPGPRRSAIVSKQEITLEDIFNEEKKKGVKELIDKHKQETLEEAAERTYREYPTNPIAKTEWNYNKDINCFRKRKAFINGAKWQQERMYSEEDLIDFAHFYFTEEFNSSMQTSKSTKDIFNEWFEQFKK